MRLVCLGVPMAGTASREERAGAHAGSCFLPLGRPWSAGTCIAITATSSQERCLRHTVSGVPQTLLTCADLHTPIRPAPAQVGTGEASCKGCGYEYSPKRGDPEYPVAPGTAFQVRCAWDVVC